MLLPPLDGEGGRARSERPGGVMLRDSRDIIARLRKDGFEEASVRGSHHKFVHRGRHLVVIVPHPRKDIPQGTVRSIYKQAGWPKD